MESDLPLIEIAGEDDSLLLTTTLDDTPASRAVNNYFPCSPLQISVSNRSSELHRVSSTKVLDDSVDQANPTRSSPKSSYSTQNIRTNKIEVPKLSMEPLQMKKRKKGGGYNLRKSLAWDRAFFTEEGVLDPLELSMISGSFGNSCGEALSSICEEGRNSFSGDSDCSTDSADLQSLGGTLHKDFPSPSLVGGKRKGACFHPKNDSLARDNSTPTSVATGRVLSTRRSRTEPKAGGCPRPLASSSYPSLSDGNFSRPANVNTSRAAGKKDSKLPKVPISKPGPSSLPTTTKTKSAILSESHLKHNQIAQPVVDVHKTVGLKSSSKNFKGLQNKAKSGPGCLPSPVKISAQHSGRSLANTLLEAQASTTPLQLPVSKTTSCLEVIPNSKVPSTAAYSSEGQDGSKLAVSLPQNSHTIAVKMQNRQNQTVKPSGLRMPSPSLGFFTQPKASGSHSLLQKNTQPSNIPKSSTCGLQKFGVLRPPYAPGRMTKDLTTSVDTGVSNSATQSAFNSVSNKIMELDLEINNSQTVELQVPNDCKSCEPIRSKHVADDIIDANLIIQECIKHDKMEKIACKEEGKLQMNDNQVLLQSGSREKLRENNSSIIKDYSRNEPETIGKIEDKFCNSSIENHTVSSKSGLGDFSNHGEESCSTLHDDHVSYIQNLDQTSSKQAELVSCSCDADWVSSGDTYNFNTRDGISKLSEESQKYETGNKRNADVKTPECSGSELEHRIQENEAVGHSPVGVLKVQAPNEILSVEKCNRNLNKQDLRVGDLSDQSEEHLELKSFCLAVEQNSPCNLELHLDDDFSLAKRSFCEESLVERAIESIETGLLERNDVNRSESSDFNSFTAHSPDQVHDTEPSVVNHEYCIDTHFSNDESLIVEATSSDLDASLSKEPVLLLLSAPLLSAPTLSAPTLSGSNVQNTEVNEPKNDVDVEEAETNNSTHNSHQKRKSTESFHSPSQFQNAEQVTGVVDEVKSSENGTKKDNLVIIKPPPDAVPFSDEWLAAIEAAGEDILTMKGGAVQNSPPEKSLPEPSPWSPVKKKNNQIGPFDCTKCTNTRPADSQ